MSTEEQFTIIYAPAVINFVTASVEFCSILESEEVINRNEWISSMLSILPLMYIKGHLLPETITIDEGFTETFVKEADYARVENKVAEIMRDENTYLDVFVDDMKYSDSPISAFVSENIADIYQDVRNFVSVYQHNLTEQMNDALYTCKENFHLYWGQKLVNVLRPLHALFNAGQEDNHINDNGLNKNDLWD